MEKEENTINQYRNEEMSIIKRDSETKQTNKTRTDKQNTPTDK